MNYDPLARGYDPRNRIEESYSYNTVPPQERPQPKAILGAQLGEQRQQGSVTREMQQLEKNLHILAAAIDNLENRLMPVCLPIPETASGLRTSDGGGCALANQLAAFNSMLSVQTARIEMIYQGVDL